MSLRSTSREEFSLRENIPCIDEVNTGALQRIADATEVMAQRHIELIDEAKRQRKRGDRLYAALVLEQNHSRALRGVITKLKNKLAAKKPTP